MMALKKLKIRGTFQEWSERRHQCTEGDPWTREKSLFGDHPEAVEIKRELDHEIYYATYRCDVCGLEFRESL